jgi:hypothetical protein
MVTTLHHYQATCRRYRATLSLKAGALSGFVYQTAVLFWCMKATASRKAAGWFLKAVAAIPNVTIAKIQH